MCPAKLAPKSNVKVLPDGEPANANMTCDSWLLPAKLNTSPTAPVPPEPVAVIVT